MTLLALIVECKRLGFDVANGVLITMLRFTGCQLANPALR